MPLPPSFLSDLRDRIAVSEIAGKRLRLTRAGREFKACCPFHNEKTPSFYINDDKQFYHCFGCGAHGDIIGFLMRHDRLSFPDAVEQLAAMAGMQVPRETPLDRERFDKETRLYQLLERATALFEEQLFTPGGSVALNYLRSRGLSDEAIRRFRLGYAPNDGQALIRALTKRAVIPDKSAADSGGFDPESHVNPYDQNKTWDSGFAPSARPGMTTERYTIDDLLAVGLVKKSEERDEVFSFFRHRVIFPVGDRKGRTVAFGARILGEGEPKYLNSIDHSLFHKGRLLYGLSRARAALSQNQPLIVAEGYMDVIALVEAGYSGAVAPLGTALTEDQLAALWKLLPPFDARDPGRDYSPILCFDGDAAGQRAAARAVERALPLLSPAQTIRVAVMPAGQDPDDLLRQAGKPAMDAVLKQARPMIEMIWELSAAGRRLQTPEDRGAFIAALKQRVNRIGNENLRQLYNDDVQKRLAAAFQWRGGDNAQNKGDWKKRGPFTPAVNVSRNPPPNASRQRERALLALMINHPGLFTDFGEDFAHMEFSVPEFEALRARAADILSIDSPEPLNAEGLYRHLTAEEPEGFSIETESPSWRRALTEVLSETNYMHVSHARPGQSLEKAHEGWRAIWNHMLKEQLKADLESARRAHAETNTDESYTRLMALREQIENLSRQGEDEGFSEAG